MMLQPNVYQTNDLANRMNGSQADLIVKVERKFSDTDGLRRRMDEDYDRWRLKKFSHEFLTGYETYTSNEPRTFLRKAVALLNSAYLSILCPQDNDPRNTRDLDNAKEQFARGNLKANDERLVKQGHITLRPTMAFHTLCRGWTTGLSVMAKKGNRSWANATPWDPRDVAWEYGPEGLLWICWRRSVLQASAEREWGLAIRQGRGAEVLRVYDYYDAELNTVLIPMAKSEPVKRMAHGTLDGYGDPIVPAWCVPTQLQPLMQAGDGGATASGMGDALVDYGESLYSENRHTYDTHNFNMSILKNLAGRSLKPVFGIESESGVKLVEGDPFETGAEIPLKIGERLVVYDMLRAAPDMLPYMTVGQGEMQRGGFPVIMYGELPATISGFMGTVLKSGPGDKVLMAAAAMEIALKTITNIWCDQFVTGAFGTSLQLSGRGGNRRWFVSTIVPDMLRDLPPLEITLKPQMPEDDAGKIQQANALRQPSPATGLPLMSDYDIRESRLERENSDQDMDTILQEMASVNPLVKAQRMTDALAKRGDEGAWFWQAQFQMLLVQAAQAGFLPYSLLERLAGGTDQGGGFSPETAPNAVQGNPPPRPGTNTPQQGGALVPPGTPRPAAREQNRGGRLRRGVPPIP